MVQELRQDQRRGDVQLGGHGQERGHQYGGACHTRRRPPPHTLLRLSPLPWQEWVGFWNNVIGHGYTEPEAVEELENLEKGEAWVDFDDDRQT